VTEHHDGYRSSLFTAERSAHVMHHITPPTVNAHEHTLDVEAHRNPSGTLTLQVEQRTVYVEGTEPLYSKMWLYLDDEQAQAIIDSLSANL
jgi:hypothetical protein